MRINQSSMSTSISQEINERLIIADLSVIDPQFALGYLEMCENNKLKEKLINTMNSANEVYFFNRLNVPRELREGGYGSILLKEVLSYCDKKDIFLVNTASNSGDMGQKKLINFYVKNSMTLVHKDGILVYHHSLTPKSQKLTIK